MAKKKKTKEELDEITQRVRKLAREGKVVKAPSEKIDSYPEIRDKFIGDVLGHPEAWVTDRSYMDDFLNEPLREGSTDYEYIVARTRKDFGVDITPVMKKPVCEVVEYIALKQKEV